MCLHQSFSKLGIRQQSDTNSPTAAGWDNRGFLFLPSLGWHKYNSLKMLGYNKSSLMA